MLTQVELKKHLSYDPETGVFIRLKMRYTPDFLVGKPAGKTDSRGHIQIRVKNRPYMAHRLAWMYVHGEFPNYQIDHINRNKEDNRISNL